MKLRVKPSVEDQGLDIHEHGEEGYGEEFTSGVNLDSGFLEIFSGQI
jgi:Amt family ammonium transporter